MVTRSTNGRGLKSALKPSPSRKTAVLSLDTRAQVTPLPLESVMISPGSVSGSRVSTSAFSTCMVGCAAVRFQAVTS